MSLVFWAHVVLLYGVALLVCATAWIGAMVQDWKNGEPITLLKVICVPFSPLIYLPIGVATACAAIYRSVTRFGRENRRRLHAARMAKLPKPQAPKEPPYR